MKRYTYIYLLILIFVLGKEIFSAYSGDIIVKNAESYVGTSINSPLPSPYIGVFDCSGLVSICAGLRRHYSVAELRTYFTLQRQFGWEDNLQPGDLLINPIHVCIFVNRFAESGINYLDVIESKSSTQEVGHTKYLDPAYYQNTYLKDHDFYPYYFIDDHTPPNINVSGVVNGGIYNKKPVILSYSITDDVDIYPYVKILLTRDGVKVIDKEYNKYENQKAKPIEETKELTQDGKYELKITAEDWENWGTKGNNVLLHFIIDYTPPKIGLKQPPYIIWVPPSEWPGGDYKSSINYPVKISFDAIDNIAVDDVYGYLDGKLVGRWED